MIQDLLAITSVTVAAVFVLSKLVIFPMMRKHRPDVPVANLVRKRGAAAKKPGCH